MVESTVDASVQGVGWSDWANLRMEVKGKVKLELWRSEKISLSIKF